MKNTVSLKKNLVKYVSDSTKKNKQQFTKEINKFISERSKYLFDTCPCDRIYYSDADAQSMMDALKIDKSVITEAISQTYYYKIAAFNPRAAKDELTILMMGVIKHFIDCNDKKNMELAIMYLAFSGKFYPSIHYMAFPKVQPSEYREVMEYVVNYKLSDKFYLKTEQTVFGAIKKIALGWYETYKNLFRRYEDEDVVYLIQQLHSRIKNFMKNIASAYYEAYDKREYISYDGDSFEEDNYHLSDSDSIKASRVIENAMSKLVSSTVDLRICKMSSNNNVKFDEVKSIIEAITNNNENVPLLKRVVENMVFVYFDSDRRKDVSDIKFIAFSITPKPNSKDPRIEENKKIVESWLEDNSVSYRKRKKRLDTKNSYFRSIYSYIAISIHVSNK